MSKYSYEERMKAVLFYIKFKYSLASFIQELGYPSSKALYKWFKEYEENDDLSKPSKGKREFTQEKNGMLLITISNTVVIILEPFVCWGIRTKTFLANGVKNQPLNLVKSGTVS